MIDEPREDEMPEFIEMPHEMPEYDPEDAAQAEDELWRRGLEEFNHTSEAYAVHEAADAMLDRRWAELSTAATLASPYGGMPSWDAAADDEAEEAAALARDQSTFIKTAMHAGLGVCRVPDDEDWVRVAAVGLENEILELLQVLDEHSTFEAPLFLALASGFPEERLHEVCERSLLLEQASVGNRDIRE